VQCRVIAANTNAVKEAGCCSSEMAKKYTISWKDEVTLRKPGREPDIRA